MKQKMQDINNKLHDLLESLTSFFEHYSDQSADQLATLQEMQKLENNVVSHLLTIENKQDTIIELLRTIAAK
uniref:hypothetical protein n=1 Tax=Prevotella sp. TaxID=59823 RepID=UPI003FEF4845